MENVTTPSCLSLFYRGDVGLFSAELVYRDVYNRTERRKFNDTALKLTDGSTIWKPMLVIYDTVNLQTIPLLGRRRVHDFTLFYVYVRNNFFLHSFLSNYLSWGFDILKYSSCRYVIWWDPLSEKFK